MSDDQNEDDDWDRELTEDEKNAGAKALFFRGAPNDFYSPEGEYNAHDKLRNLTTVFGMEFPKDDPLRDASQDLRDVVEDHERLLRLALWMRDVLQNEAGRLDGAGAMLNVRKVREDLLNALGTLNGELGRLYLDEI